MTAYLVMSFRVIKGIPRFQGLGIYSEPATSLTRMGGIEYAQLMEWNGNSYGEAHDSLLAYILSQPHMAWMHPWVDPANHRGELEKLTVLMKRI